MIKLEHSLNFNHLYSKNWFILKKVPIEAKLAFSELSKRVINNPGSYQPSNEYLIGQIQKEYRVELPDEFLNYLSKILVEYREEIVGNIFEDFSHFDFSNWVLGNLYQADDWSKKIGWVNFQKKFEYNPSHAHDGHLSFIYWDKVPYTKISEIRNTPSPSATGGENLNGSTVFYFNRDNWYAETNTKRLNPSESFGAKMIALPVTSQWEGTLCIFPSYQLHSVYPFYSSDDYRISYSGNIVFRKPPSLM